MDYSVFKNTGTLTRPDHWPVAGAQVVLSLEGVVHIQTSAGSQSLDACTGIILQNVESVDFENAKGLLIGLDAERQRPEDAFVLDPLTVHLALDVFFENRGGEPHRRAALSFLLHHLGLVDEPESVSSNIGLSLVDRVMAYMHARMEEPLTLEELADEAHCTSQTLIKEFHSSRGQSPMQCLAEMRLDKAKSLLAETEASVTQVAHLVGYSTISGFSHFFKKHTGLSPKGFRENVQWLV
jgi:AraC-like DNA-binding protein